MDQAHDPTALDPTMEEHLAGQFRLSRTRMSVRMGPCGFGGKEAPMLVLHTAGSESHLTTAGLSLEHLTLAADIFNAVIATGKPPEPADPVADRRRRAAAAEAIGDRVRAMVLEAGL